MGEDHNIWKIFFWFCGSLLKSQLISKCLFFCLQFLPKNLFSGYIESQSETSNQYRARTAGTTKRRERLLRPPSNISRSLGDTEFYEQVAETIFLQGKPTQARTYELKDCYRDLLLRYHLRFYDQTTYTYIGNKHFFMTCHRKTYQNYEQPPQRLQNLYF